MRKLSLLLCAALISSLPFAATAAPPKPVKHGYVVNSLTFPFSSEQARSLGRDLTGDGKPDNQLGMVLAQLSSQGLDLSAVIAETIESGDLLALHSLRTTSLANAKNATLRLFGGKAKANPDLNGGGTFGVDTSAPSVKLAAKIKDRAVKAGPGKIPFAFPTLVPGEKPVVLTLKKGRVNATCRKARCEDGRITGAISMTQINAKFVPTLAKLFQSLVDQDCPTKDTCEAGSNGQTVLNIFDADDDGQITATELRENNLIEALLAPDVDLVKANGKPGQDGVKDAMSFGVGFTSAWAKIRGD